MSGVIFWDAAIYGPPKTGGSPPQNDRFPFEDRKRWRVSVWLRFKPGCTQAPPFLTAPAWPPSRPASAASVSGRRENMDTIWDPTNIFLGDHQTCLVPFGFPFKARERGLHVNHTPNGGQNSVGIQVNTNLCGWWIPGKIHSQLAQTGQEPGS